MAGDKPQTTEQEARTDATQAGTPVRTVLVVDDDDRVREALEEGLTLLGFAVITASDGGDAMQILASDTPINLMLSDIVMAGISGIELARSCRRVRPNLPVLLITGHAFELVAQLGARNEEFRVVQKPCPIDKLAALVNKTIDEAPG